MSEKTKLSDWSIKRAEKVYHPYASYTEGTEAIAAALERVWEERGGDELLRVVERVMLSRLERCGCEYHKPPVKCLYCDAVAAHAKASLVVKEACKRDDTGH